MKIPFLTILNSKAQDVMNSVSGAWQSLTLADGEKKKRFCYCKFGEYPQTLADGTQIVQVVDKIAGEQIVSNFRKCAGLATFIMGIPVYEGHADDPAWLEKNPGHKASAVGRLKSVDVDNVGINVEGVYNDDGVSMLSGDAPKYSGHSARWRCEPVEGRPNHYRPVLLWSDALTNYPNIPGSTMVLNTLGMSDDQPSPTDAANAVPEPENENETMKLSPELLKCLGFAPDATPSNDEISAAIIKALAAKKTEEAPTDAVTATNSAELTAMRGQLKELTDTRNLTVINEAIRTGKITEADKPKWITALNASYESESAKLDALMPTINTGAAPALGGRREGSVDVANTVATQTEAVRAYAKEKGIDVSNAAGWDQAFNGCKAEKPELFVRG